MRLKEVSLKRTQFIVACVVALAVAASAFLVVGGQLAGAKTNEVYSFNVPVVQELKGAPDNSYASYSLKYSGSMSESEKMMPKGYEEKDSFYFEIRNSGEHNLTFNPTHAGVWSYKIKCENVVSSDEAYTVAVDSAERELVVAVKNGKDGLEASAMWQVNGSKVDENVFIHEFSKAGSSTVSSKATKTGESFPWALVAVLGAGVAAVVVASVVRSKRKNQKDLDK